MALSKYTAILQQKARPRFKSADLGSKTEIAFDMLRDCHLCERDCRVDRTQGQSGICRIDDRLRVSSAFDHLGEEPFFVPSFTIFFPSCTFSCIFCQNWDISQVENIEQIESLTAPQLAAIIDRHNHCKNVNFVGGDPTPHLPFILSTLRSVKSDIPVVWNSNFYMSEDTMQLLSGVVDVYLPDFKYGNDECAKRLSDADYYSRVIRRNLRLAFDDAEVVIRHLILPDHIDCCTEPILKFIAENFSDRVIVNLMDQYRPCYRVKKDSQIGRRITSDELHRAVRRATDLGINFIT